MEAIKKAVDKHVPLTTKMKTKKDCNPRLNKDSQSSKLNEGWLRNDGLYLHNNRSS